eukprot:1392574-Amorphochlora_amoeboformis.AAC.2
MQDCVCSVRFCESSQTPNPLPTKTSGTHEMFNIGAYRDVQLMQMIIIPALGSDELPAQLHPTVSVESRRHRSRRHAPHASKIRSSNAGLQRFVVRGGGTDDAKARDHQAGTGDHGKFT